MARTSRTVIADRAGVERLLAPRDGLVLERRIAVPGSEDRAADAEPARAACADLSVAAVGDAPEGPCVGPSQHPVHLAASCAGASCPGASCPGASCPGASCAGASCPGALRGEFESAEGPFEGYRRCLTARLMTGVADGVEDRPHDDHAVAAVQQHDDSAPADAPALVVCRGFGWGTWRLAELWKRTSRRPAHSADTPLVPDLASERWEVTETVVWQLRASLFAPVVNVAVRAALRREASRIQLGLAVPGAQPIWAPPQRLDPRAVSVFARLCVLSMLAGFIANAPAEMHTYAADEFGVSQFSQGALGAIVRVGTLAAVAVSVLTDRLGRRRVLGWAVAVALVGVVGAAAAPGLGTFGAVLLVTRAANAALGTCITVMALEEMPAGCRAWTLSVLAMVAALGAGVVVWSHPLAALDERAWRAVFCLPLLAVVPTRRALRGLSESRRFVRRATEVAFAGSWRPMLLLGGLFFALGLFLGPIDWFRNEYLRDEHGLSSAQLSLFLLTTATPGGLGLYAAGRLAETRGRRAVMATAVFVGLGAITLMFSVGGLLMWVLALVGAVVSAGLLPTMGVYRGELFPAAVRARAATVTGAMGVAGGAVGVLSAGWLRTVWGSFGTPMMLLFLGPAVAAAVVVTCLAETGRRELESLHPPDAAALARWEASSPDDTSPPAGMSASPADASDPDPQTPHRSWAPHRP